MTGVDKLRPLNDAHVQKLDSDLGELDDRSPADCSIEVRLSV